MHLYEGHVGGGFGIRGELYPEDVLVCVAALRLGRPVKWIEDRREHLIAANHSRQQRHRIRAAVDATGRILAIDDEFFHDQGAYVRTHAATVPDLAAAMLPGPYRVPAYRVGRPYPADQQDAVRHLSRARPLREHVRARAADGRDRRAGSGSIAIEVRRRNLIATAEMPYDAAARYARHRDRARFRRLCRACSTRRWRRVGWDALQRRARGAPRSRRAGRRRPRAVRREERARPVRRACGSASMTDGTVEVVTGAASVGQGIETVIAQICADALGVDYRSVRVVHGQTDRIDYGMGAFASRVTVMTGEATRIAAPQGASEGDRGRRRTAADAGRRARHRRRRGGAHRRGGGPSIGLGDDRAALAPGSKLASRARGRTIGRRLVHTRTT